MGWEMLVAEMSSKRLGCTTRSEVLIIIKLPQCNLSSGRPYQITYDKVALEL